MHTAHDSAEPLANLPHVSTTTSPEPSPAPSANTAEVSANPRFGRVTVAVYTVSEDGHYIGTDGFVVPANFAEFHHRYPHYLRNWVRRKMFGASEMEMEDRISELNIFLMELPPGSKFSKPGFRGLPNGCQDRIQIFDPECTGGATCGMFLNFLSNILWNQQVKLAKKLNSNPLCRLNTVHMLQADNFGEIVDEDYLLNRSRWVGHLVQKAYNEGVGGLLVDDFVAYVEKHNPELVPVLAMISKKDTYVESQRELGMTEMLFLRARNRIAVLHEHYAEGKVPPRQRRVYRTRKNRLSTEHRHLHPEAEIA